MRSVLLLVFSSCISHSFAQSSCPTLQVQNVDTCGAGTFQLDATNPGYTNYSWTPAAGLSATNIPNPLATVSGNATYTVIASGMGPNLIPNPDFALGNTGFTSGHINGLYTPGNYHVGPLWFGYLNGWTDNTPTSDNYFMSVDGSTTLTTLWETTLTIDPNTNYEFFFHSSNADQVQPDIKIEFIGNVTGSIILDTAFALPYFGTIIWTQFAVPSWNSGANTSVTIKLTNLELNGYGNDFGLDDFSFRAYCTDTAVVQINTQAATTTTSPPVAICTGDSAVLSANGGVTYWWSTNDTASSIVVTPNTNTTYSVLFTDTNGCQVTMSQQVLVFPQPIATITGDTIVCSGDSITLTASGGSIYLWSNNDNTATLTDQPLQTQNYTVSVSNGLCSSTATQMIYVNPVPIATISGAASICAGDSIILSASGGNNYQWSHGPTSSTIIVSPPSSQFYSLIAEDGGCTDTTTHLINVVPKPVADILGDTLLCRGDQMTLTAVGGATYLWQAGQTTDTIQVAPILNQLFSVKAFNGSCVDSTEIMVWVIDLPPVSISGDSIICHGNQAILAATGGTNYLWSNGFTTPAIIVNPQADSVYSVTSFLGTCTDSASFQIRVRTPPSITINGDGNICEGDIVTLSASGGLYYLWSTSDTIPTIQVSPMENTIYTVKVSDDHCSSTMGFPVRVNPLPEVHISGEEIVCAGNEIILTASGDGPFLWENGEQTATIVVAPISDSQYAVTVNSGQCSATASHLVTMDPDEMTCNCRWSIYTPNAFSPNKDDLNEFFRPEVDCDLLDYRMAIYDRWGALVFETTTLDIGWDGTYKGQDAPVDLYAIKIWFTTPDKDYQRRSYDGHVMLVR